jgi:hypothetical protein
MSALFRVRVFVFALGGHALEAVPRCLGIRPSSHPDRVVACAEGIVTEEAGVPGRRSAARILMAIAAPLAILIGGGCGTTINHTYDPSTNFAPLKSYAWAPGSPIYSQNSLVEANVQFVADPLLEKKGFKKATPNPDLVIRVKLENYPFDSAEGYYELRMLGLNVYRADGQTLIWRGTASGSISTDAASGDLNSAVQAILAVFPPR